MRGGWAVASLVVPGGGAGEREVWEGSTGAEVGRKGSALGGGGPREEVDAVRRGVGMSLDGAPHGAVYSFLERKHNELTQGFDVRQSG